MLCFSAYTRRQYSLIDNETKSLTVVFFHRGTHYQVQSYNQSGTALPQRACKKNTTLVVLKITSNGVVSVANSLRISQNQYIFCFSGCHREVSGNQRNTSGAPSGCLAQGRGAKLGAAAGWGRGLGNAGGPAATSLSSHPVLGLPKNTKTTTGLGMEETLHG